MCEDKMNKQSNHENVVGTESTDCLNSNLKESKRNESNSQQRYNILLEKGLING